MRYRRLSPIPTSTAMSLALAAMTLAACAPRTAPATHPNPATGSSEISAGPRSSVTAIVGATLWDGTGRAPIPNATVVVRGDRIACAGSRAACPVPARARIVTARDRWLIPGLIDSHVHLLFLIDGSAGDEFADDLHDLLAQGITTVRDMGNDPAELVARARRLPGAPRVYAMQLVAGPRFFFNGFHATPTSRGVIYRQPPALTMQRMGWTPILFRPDDDPDSVVAAARAVGALGLKLYAELDSVSVRRLVAAAHRGSMPVWGHAWVQPASVLEQVRAGQDGVVHAAGLAGELFSAEQRDTLVHDGDLQVATAAVATVDAARDPRILAALDSMARYGTMFEPTLDAVAHSVAQFARRERQIASIQERYVQAAAGFGIEIAREAVRHGVRISAGSDHVAYGPRGDRATLRGELRLLVDSVHLTPTTALLAATRDAARAIGGPAAREAGTVEAGRSADLVLLRRNPLDDVDNLDAIEWVMHGGQVWRPAELRRGIANPTPRQ